MRDSVGLDGGTATGRGELDAPADDGAVDDGVIDLSSTVVSLAPTASPVTELRRRIQGRGEELSFELEMAMEGGELGWHVGSTLARA